MYHTRLNTEALRRLTAYGRPAPGRSHMPRAASAGLATSPDSPRLSRLRKRPTSPSSSWGRGPGTRTSSGPASTRRRASTSTCTTCVWSARCRTWCGRSSTPGGRQSWSSAPASPSPSRGSPRRPRPWCSSSTRPSRGGARSRTCSSATRTPPAGCPSASRTTSARPPSTTTT